MLHQHVCIKYADGDVAIVLLAQNVVVGGVLGPRNHLNLPVLLQGELSTLHARRRTNTASSRQANPDEVGVRDLLAVGTDAKVVAVAVACAA